MPFSTSSSPDNSSIVIDDDGRLAVADNLTESLRGSILDLSVDIAELNYYASLNADSREDLFVDSLVDADKIKSLNNLAHSTGQDSNISLTGKVETDDMEDGNTILDYESESNTNITTQEAINGTYSLRMSHNEGNAGGTRDLQTPIVGSTSLTFYVTALDPGDDNRYGFRYALEDDSNNRPVNLFITSTGITINGLDIMSVSTGATYKITIDIDFVANEVTATSENLDSGNVDSRTANPDEFNALTTQEVSADGAFTSLDFVVDDIPYAGGYKSQGTLESVEIDKGYIPNGIQVEADRITDSERTIQARVYDIDGNETVIDESQFGEQVDLSFSSSAFNVDIELSTTNATKTPKVNDYGLNTIR